MSRATQPTAKIPAKTGAIAQSIKNKSRGTIIYNQITTKYKFAKYQNLWNLMNL